MSYVDNGPNFVFLIHTAYAVYNDAIIVTTLITKSSNRYLMYYFISAFVTYRTDNGRCTK